jgi:hypothetical protein
MLSRPGHPDAQGTITANTVAQLSHAQIFPTLPARVLTTGDVCTKRKTAVRTDELAHLSRRAVAA